MHPRFMLALTPLLFSPCFAQALDCSNAMDQASMNQCAALQHKAADRELNALYQQIITRLQSSPDSKKLLVNAQRSWIAFRDAECRFSASTVAGGSAYPLIVSQCVTDLTNARVERLKSYLQCPEGDMGCPVPRQ